MQAMHQSDRFGLPLLAPGQAQKELFHNEALILLDLLTGGRVEAVGEDAPPPDPDAGKCWIISGSPTGEWLHHPHHLAAWTSSGWRFVAPPAGLRMTTPAGLIAEFDGSAWRVGTVHGTVLKIGGVQVVGAQQPAIPAPVGGVQIDVEARVSISSILTILRSHGLIAG